jgi:TRAP-type C4-dicarboxylate transport system permease large subunit
MNREPFIVGPTADKLLGFLAGIFGNVMGFFGTIVVMYLWAGSQPAPDVQERRQHAQSVSIWSAVGCLLPIVLILAILALGVLAFSSATTSGGPMSIPERLVP